MSSAPTSTDGQPLGRRGVQTRQRILEALAQAIEQHGLRGLRLADIADEVGFSPPAFYQYFVDLDEAILTLCHEVGELVPRFELDATGLDVEHPQGTQPFVERFFAYWDEHRQLLWARNVSITAGDDRFRDVRNDTITPMVEGLRETIRAGQQAGRIDPAVSPVALGAVLTVMLDRISMLAPELSPEWSAADRKALVPAVAYVFDQVLGIERAEPGATPARKRAAPRRRST
ncbi:MAG TPA: TetR/AcrR family transcriptional regulator [Acidimicrobiales bacterium]|nr:TetR/AcrR family transcriptional regulator [Acidimicrobiales bacterium]